ncbi:MAG: hypothetical protein QOH25_2841 [Acidobacteriota bacterium]|jgi:pimeloyl-ACP methyl ester carboxylesterase|nr:hypothetical protein [Acidobacteriota bacterium]
MRRLASQYPSVPDALNALRIKKTLILLPILMSLTSGAQAIGQSKADSLKMESYSFETYDKQKVEAELGRLVVPENRRRARSNAVELAFVRFKSVARLPASPIVFLSGGPGASGIGEARGAAFPLLMALREIGDVIVLDQRGTGMSKPGLICSQTWNFPLDKPGDPQMWMLIAKEKLRACAQEVKNKGIDLGGYNTNESADDVEALRQALGVKKINLWGISYGTHLALAAIRRHGRSIDRAILTGVNGPDHLMMKLPSTIQEQLFKLDKLFKADAKVSGLIPDFPGLLKNLLDKLDKNPVTVEITDPRTKQKVSVALSKWDLQFHVASPVTQTWSIMGLPAFFYAMSQGDFTPLAQRALEFRQGQVGSMMAWMMLSASAVSHERQERIKREAGETLLGNAINFPFPEISEALGQPDLGAKFRAPVKSGIPALFISGTLDGRTPASNAEEVMKGFPKGEHLIVEGASHGYDLFYFTPQVKDSMLEFLKGHTIPTKRITLAAFPFNPVNPQKP